MVISKETYEKFYNLTNYDLSSYVLEVRDFTTNNLSSIIEFYSGKIKNLDKKHIKKLNELSEEVLKILSIFRDYKKIFKTVEFWGLLDNIEDIRTHLNYCQNISKYLRSSIVNGKFEAGYSYDYVMSENETLEDISRTELNKGNFQQQWSEIAVKNDLREVDWSIKGGKKIDLVNDSFQSMIVTSMIDNTIGDRIYGKDIKRLLEFRDDDLIVLEYKETALQTIDNLSKLSKGDIPEFPTMGINDSVWKGSNVSRVNFPLIIRELRSIFNTDDLFKDFNVKKIEYKEGDIFIEYEVGTKRDLVIINNITI